MEIVAHEKSLSKAPLKTQNIEVPALGSTDGIRAATEKQSVLY